MPAHSRLPRLHEAAVPPLKLKGRGGKPVQAKNSQFEQLHPRAPLGRTGGGEFVVKGSAGTPLKHAIKKRLGVKAGGPDFTQAVRAFQQKNGLKVDGVVGHQTASALTGSGKTKEKPGKLTKQDRQGLLKGHTPGSRQRSRRGSSSSSSGSGGSSSSGKAPTVAQLQRMAGVTPTGSSSGSSRGSSSGSSSRGSSSRGSSSGSSGSSGGSSGSSGSGSSSSGGSSSGSSRPSGSSSGGSTSSGTAGGSGGSLDDQLAKWAQGLSSKRLAELRKSGNLNPKQAKAAKRELGKRRKAKPGDQGKPGGKGERGRGSKRVTEGRATISSVPTDRLEEASVRGESRRVFRRLPDGTFAPSGRGRILEPGDTFSIPHRSYRPGRALTPRTAPVRARVIRPSPLRSGVHRARIETGPDAGQQITVHEHAPPPPLRRGHAVTITDPTSVFHRELGTVTTPSAADGAVRVRIHNDDTVYPFDPGQVTSNELERRAERSRSRAQEPPLGAPGPDEAKARSRSEQRGASSPGRDPVFKPGEKIGDRNGVKATVREHHPHASGNSDKDRFTLELPDGSTTRRGYGHIGDVLAGYKTWPDQKGAASPGRYRDEPGADMEAHLELLSNDQALIAVDGKDGKPLAHGNVIAVDQNLGPDGNPEGKSVTLEQGDGSVREVPLDQIGSIDEVDGAASPGRGGPVPSQPWTRKNLEDHARRNAEFAATMKPEHIPGEPANRVARGNYGDRALKAIADNPNADPDARAYARRELKNRGASSPGRPEAFQQRHYVAVADAISRLPGEQQREEAAQAFADAFAPRGKFDRSRFMSASLRAPQGPGGTKTGGSRKDYEAMAQMLREVDVPSDTRENLASSLADSFAAGNPNFSRSKFLDAALPDPGDWQKTAGEEAAFQRSIGAESPGRSPSGNPRAFAQMKPDKLLAVEPEDADVLKRVNKARVDKGFDPLPDSVLPGGGSQPSEEKAAAARMSLADPSLLLDSFAERPDFAGYGYLGHRENLGSRTTANREYPGKPAVQKRVDKAVVKAANDLGWTEEQLFEWANSKYGRHFAEENGGFHNTLKASESHAKALESMKQAEKGLADEGVPVFAVRAGSGGPAQPETMADLMRQADAADGPRSESVNASPAQVAELVRRVPPGGYSATSGEGGRALNALDALSIQSRRRGLEGVGDADLARLYLTAEDANFHTLNQDVERELRLRGHDYSNYERLAGGRLGAQSPGRAELRTGGGEVGRALRIARADQRDAEVSGDRPGLERARQRVSDLTGQARGLAKGMGDIALRNQRAEGAFSPGRNPAQPLPEVRPGGRAGVLDHDRRVIDYTRRSDEDLNALIANPNTPPDVRAVARDALRRKASARDAGLIA